MAQAQDEPDAPEPTNPRPPDPEIAHDLHPNEVRLALCMPSVRGTVLSSILGSLLTFLGLLAFGFAEGMKLPRWATLSLRFAGWICLLILPVYATAVPGLRNFFLWGLQPGGHLRRIRRVGLLQQLSWLTIFAALTYIPIHSQVLGFFPVFAIGKVLSMVAAIIVARIAGPPVLSSSYARSMGPSGIFLPVFGFVVLLSGYLAIRQVAGVFVSSLLMPLLLSAYEFLGTRIVSRNFVVYFVTKPEVRELYATTNQGIVVSICICCFHAMAEGARLTLIYVEYMDSRENQNLDVLFPILSSVAWNVLMRIGCMDRVMTVLSRGRLKPQNTSKLLRDAGYCMGYPRFGAVAALLLTRLSLGTSVVLSELEGWLWVLMVTAELVEDVLGYILWRLGVDVSPVKRFATQQEVEQMSEKIFVRRLSQSSGRPDLSVVPQPKKASRTSTCSSASSEVIANHMSSVKSIQWEVRMGHDFKYAPGEFGVLPLWAHLLPVFYAQSHTVLAMTVLSNGLSYILGFCTRSNATSSFWWPLPGETCSF